MENPRIAQGNRGGFPTATIYSDCTRHGLSHGSLKDVITFLQSSSKTLMVSRNFIVNIDAINTFAEICGCESNPYLGGVSVISILAKVLGVILQHNAIFEGNGKPG